TRWPRDWSSDVCSSDLPRPCRPLSHSLRLFGNILAGHIVLKVFGGMVVALLGAGAWGLVAIAPFGMAVALTGLEFLVAALQAFEIGRASCRERGESAGV